MGIGTNNSKSKLQVSDGDVFIDNPMKGLILKSPNGNCWRVTLDNIGNFIKTEITCHNAPIPLNYINKPNARNGKDAVISSGNMNAIYATAYYTIPCVWTNNGTPLTNRSIISFDLTSIPTNAIIDSAFVNLFFNQTNADLASFFLQGGHYGDNAMYFQKIMQAWDENTITWSNQPTTSTQNQISVSAATTKTQNYRVNIKPLVIDLVENPNTNFGFLIRMQKCKP